MTRFLPAIITVPLVYALINGAFHLVGRGYLPTASGDFVSDIQAAVCWFFGTGLSVGVYLANEDDD